MEEDVAASTAMEQDVHDADSANPASSDDKASETTASYSCAGELYSGIISNFFLNFLKQSSKDCFQVKPSETFSCSMKFKGACDKVWIFSGFAKEWSQ